MLEIRLGFRIYHAADVMTYIEPTRIEPTRIDRLALIDSH